MTPESETKVSVLLRTSEYRGDHSTDIAVAHDIRPGETVSALVDRLKPGPSEWIEIRAIVVAEV